MKQEIELFNAGIQQTEHVEVTYYVHEPWMGGERFEIHFANRYGASVIRYTNEYGGSYGAADGLWELAVLVDKAGTWEIAYHTTVADDVLGWLSEVEVIDTLKKIAALDAQKEIE